MLKESASGNIFWQNILLSFALGKNVSWSIAISFFHKHCRDFQLMYVFPWFSAYVHSLHSMKRSCFDFLSNLLEFINCPDTYMIFFKFAYEGFQCILIWIQSGEISGYISETG